MDQVSSRSGCKENEKHITFPNYHTHVYIYRHIFVFVCTQPFNLAASSNKAYMPTQNMTKPNFLLSNLFILGGFFFCFP